MNEVKGILYKTDGTMEAVILKPRTRLKTLQKLVGGYIEVVQLREYRKEVDSLLQVIENDLVINEEGVFLNLPVNPFSSLVGKNTIWENQQFRGDILLIEGRLP